MSEQFVNLETGEIKNIHSYTTKEQHEAINKAINYKKSQDEFHMYIAENLGQFYFNFYARVGKHTEQFLTRFLYLCTYMNYEGLLSHGYNGCNLIRENELQEIFGLGRMEFFKTKKYLLENEMIIINKNKTVLINTKYCIRGEIKMKNNTEVIRMFDDGIKEMYENSNPSEHKRLAIFIKILPYVNYKHNVICFNPNEQSVKEIIPMTLKDMCEVCGYDSSHSSRLKNELLKVKIKGESAFGGFLSEKRITFVINPRVYYKGDNIDELKALSNLFRINDNKKSR